MKEKLLDNKHLNNTEFKRNMKTKLFHVFLFLTLLVECLCNKYSQNINEEPHGKFRMMKVQQLWEKAQKRLSGKRLADLSADLMVQDQAERELKKMKVKNLDENGLKEAEVRENFVGLIRKYGLEEHFSETKYDPSRNEIPMDETSLKFTDKRLQKLWKKAESSGFSDDELNTLKQEFWHQQVKLDEYNALRDDLMATEDIMDNTIESYDNKKSLKEKSKQLKQKNKDIKDAYDKLEGLASQNTEDLEFQDMRVYELWALARKANMSEDELRSLKEELKHFENRIKKHEYLQEQVKMSESEMKERYKDGVYPEKHRQLEETARTYEKRVHKHHADIKKRVETAIRSHSEL